MGVVASGGSSRFFGQAAWPSTLPGLLHRCSVARGQRLLLTAAPLATGWRRRRQRPWPRGARCGAPGGRCRWGCCRRCRCCRLGRSHTAQRAGRRTLRAKEEHSGKRRGRSSWQASERGREASAAACKRGTPRPGPCCSPGVLLLAPPELAGRPLRPPPALGVRNEAPGGTGGVPTTACSPLLPILLERRRSTTGRARRRPPLMKPPAKPGHAGRAPVGARPGACPRTHRSRQRRHAWTAAGLRPLLPPCAPCCLLSLPLPLQNPHAPSP